MSAYREGVPVVVDGTLRFPSVKRAAQHASDAKWAVSYKAAYTRISNAVHGVNHEALGHTFEKGETK